MGGIRRAVPLVILISAVLWMFSAPVSAQFYKYTDENGVVRFTDDLNMIPKEQREEIPAYRESKSPEPEAAPAEAETETADTGSLLSDDEEASEAELEQESKRLEALRGELQQEYEALLQEQERIKPDKAVTRSAAKVKEYERRKAALKERAGKYDAKRKAYEAEVQAYNERIRAMQEAARTPAEE